MNFAPSGRKDSLGVLQKILLNLCLKCLKVNEIFDLTQLPKNTVICAKFICKQSVPEQARIRQRGKFFATSNKAKYICNGEERINVKE